jgi:hypothetical protein
MLYWIDKQHARMELGVDGLIAGVRIDAERRVEIPRRDGIADLAGDRDRPDPGERIGQIAQAFAKIDIRDVGVEGFRAHICGSRAAPLDTEANRHHELMLGALENPVFEGGIEVLETVGPGRRRIDRAKESVGRAKRYRKILGDPF